MRSRALGLIYALLAYLSWGFVVPVHFRLLDDVPVAAILAHRIVWAALLVAGLIALMRKRLANPFPLKARYGFLVLSAAMIGLNWLLYLVAVQSGHMLDASLGYFINPIVSVALGAAVLRERLRPLQLVAVAIVCLGIGLAVAMAGRLPALSLTLAVSFALYGLLRKLAGVDAMVGFLAETLLLMPIALPYLLLVPEATPADPRQLWLLALTGVTTALPMIWFAAAAMRLSLATLGLMQYIAPSCLMLLSIAVYGERLTLDRAVLFGLIWLALILYATDSLRAARSVARSAAKPAAGSRDRA